MIKLFGTGLTILLIGLIGCFAETQQPGVQTIASDWKLALAVFLVIFGAILAIPSGFFLFIRKSRRG